MPATGNIHARKSKDGESSVGYKESTDHGTETETETSQEEETSSEEETRTDHESSTEEDSTTEDETSQEEGKRKPKAKEKKKEYPSREKEGTGEQHKENDTCRESGIVLGAIYGILAPVNTCMGLDKVDENLLHGLTVGKTVVMNAKKSKRF
ncbi:hypothetical protein NDU88_001124 [Pleurodeles waltl]|uniref:Uncharacterized protein n=1 Tax=Pleurodeles waltl TaxID=8319 RepID=A0AAV7MJP3_PLEWA|nr:hypothetical protein NDU88_001124 [Pleurodeles waltl]